MKYYIKIGVLVLLLSGVTEVAKGADNWKKTDGKWTFSRDAKQLGSRKDNVVKYQLELSPPEGTFIQPTKTNSDMVHDTPGSVKAEKVLDLNTPSSFDYSIKMNGTLKIEGEGSGVLSWSAVENLLEPLRIEEPLAAGVKATFKAFRGAEACDGVTWSGSKGLTIKESKGSTVEVSATNPGIYTLTASHLGEKATAAFVRLKVVFKSNSTAPEVTKVQIRKNSFTYVWVKLQPDSVENDFQDSIDKKVIGAGVKFAEGRVIGSKKLDVGEKTGKLTTYYKTDVIGELEIEPVDTAMKLLLIP